MQIAGEGPEASSVGELLAAKGQVKRLLFNSQLGFQGVKIHRSWLIFLGRAKRLHYDETQSNNLETLDRKPVRLGA